MPNHTANIVTITGPEADVLRFVENAKAKKARKNDDDELVFEALDFDSFLPMPEELRNTYSPVHIQTQEEIDKLWADYRKLIATLPENDYRRKEGKPFGVGVTQEQYDSMMAKYGCADWYSWANSNWGTKWGAYDVKEWEVNGASASIKFDTAWSPAIPFWTTVSKQYPTLKFVNEYADEGGGFLGFSTIENGSEVETKVEWDSEDGIELRKKLGRWYEDEEDDEDESDDE